MGVGNFLMIRLANNILILQDKILFGSFNPSFSGSNCVSLSLSLLLLGDNLTYIPLIHRVVRKSWTIRGKRSYVTTTLGLRHSLLVKDDIKENPTRITNGD